MIGVHPSGELLSDFINFSPQAICVTTMNEIRFIEVNSNFEKFIGLSRESIINHKLENLGIKFSNEAVKDIIEEVSLKGKIIHRELEIELPVSGKRIISVTCHLIQVGNEPSLLTFADDITEIRQVEEKHKETY